MDYWNERCAMNPVSLLIRRLPAYILALYIAILSPGCRVKDPAMEVTSAFLEAWKKGSYDKAYEYLSDSCRGMTDFQEFRGERELIDIASYIPRAQASAQGLFFARYAVSASWNAGHSGKDPEITGVDFLVVKRGNDWKIAALEEVLRERDDREFASLKIQRVDERMVSVLFLDHQGKRLFTSEIPLAPGEVLEYVRSNEEELDICRENLKKISVALEAYGIDNGGKYPLRLEGVVPRYLEALPACPSGGMYVYVREPKLKTWIVRCARNAHRDAGVDGEFPAFFPARGVVDR